MQLAWDLAKRDLWSKYRRSLIGPLWLLLTPLALLGIYWLIFGAIFGVKWSDPVDPGEHVGFLLPFFIGLAAYLALSDVVNSSSTLFASKRTYVVKSPFPLWVLYAANLMRAYVHALISFALVLVVAVIQQRLSLKGLGWFVVDLALCMGFVSAVALLLASLGPFIGDISEAMRLLLRILFYGTPITYPLSMVPQPYRDLMWLNPLTSIVELLRIPLVFGQAPSLTVWFGLAAATTLLGILSMWIFNRVRGVISDVV